MPRLNPEDFPEELRPQIEAANAEYDQALAASQRFEGINADPTRLREALTMYDQYTDASTSEKYRTQMARQWGILSEDQSLNDLREFNRQIQELREQQQATPFAGVDPEELTPDAFVSVLDQRYVDPQTLEQRLADMERKLASVREQEQTDADVAALNLQAKQFETRLKREGSELTDEDRDMVWAVLNHRLMNDKVDETNFHTAFEDAYAEYRSKIDAHAAELLKRQKGAPRTGRADGATPSTDIKVTDIKSGIQYAERQLAAMRAARAEEGEIE